MSIEAFKAKLIGWHRFYTGKDTIPSANYKDSAFKDEPEIERKIEAYYTSKGLPDSKWHTGRPVAYLTTYVDWVNGRRFSATGIAVGSKYVLPDRDVMHAMLHGGCVEFDDEKAEFVLTDKGIALLAPFYDCVNFKAGARNA